MCRGKRHQRLTSAARPICAERLESRLLLSVTDLDASFGGVGTVAAVAVTAQYGAGYQVVPDGDVIATATYATQSGDPRTTPPDYFLRVADVSPGGQARWATTINFTPTDTPSSVFPLSPGSATRLSDGSVVLEVERVYGNSATAFLDKFDPAGNVVPSFTANYGTFAGGADAGGGIIALLPRADGSLLSVYGTSGGRYTIQVIGADGTKGAVLVTNAALGTPDGLSRVQAVTLQGDGRILLAGTVYDATANRLVLRRLNADGTLDVSFGINGTANTGLDATPRSVQVDGGARLVVTVSTYKVGTEIVRLTSTGTLDTTFAGGGVAGPFRRVSVSNAKVAADDSLYVAGTRRDQPYLLHLSATGSVLQAAVGSALETQAGGVETTGDGRLVTYLSNGVIRGAVGFSQPQPTGDGGAPVATLGRLRRVTPGASSYFVSVTYGDTGGSSIDTPGTGVDPQTLATGNLVLKYGRNHLIYGQLVADTDAGNGQINATYSFAAPGGTWTSDDAGTYVIQTASDEVTDNAGNGLPAQTLGSFLVRSAKRTANASTARPATANASTTIATPAGAASDWLKSARSLFGA